MSTTPVLCIQVNAEIHLRLLEERHLWDYFALIERNQEHLREWTAEEAYEGSIETLGASVKQHLLRFTEGSGYHLGIWYQDRLVGVLDYRLNRRNDTVELSYWLDAAMEGKGIITQACRAMIRHAFEEHQVHRIEIACVTTNTRSRSVAEHLGFIQEGVLRQADRLHGRYGDRVYYGLLVNEWDLEAKHAQGHKKETS
jgi:ribosomal-protein-serine acetyltransferase